MSIKENYFGKKSDVLATTVELYKKFKPEVISCFLSTLLSMFKCFSNTFLLENKKGTLAKRINPERLELHYF